MSVQSLQNQSLELRELTVSNAFESQATGYVAQSTTITPSSITTPAITSTDGIIIGTQPTDVTLSCATAGTLAVGGGISTLSSIEIGNGTNIPATLSCATGSTNKVLILQNALQIDNGVTIPVALSCATGAVNSVLTVTGNIQVTGGFLDGALSPGLNGQVLTSNGAGWYWANP